MTVPPQDSTQVDGPKWRTIADVTRAEILSGHYPPGAPLPGETALAERYKTSRPTVRRAIAELQGEGLVSASQGRGTYVRARPDRRAVVIGSSKHIDLLGEPYAALKAGWWPETHPDAPTSNPHEMITRATREQGEALRIPTGEVILYRYQYWRHRTFQHVISVTSATPAHLIADPTYGSAPGYTFDPTTATMADAETAAADERAPSRLYSQLAAHSPVHFTTTATARMPRANELNDLGTEPGTPLLVIQRTMTDAHGHPLEVTQIEAPADRIEALTAEPGTRTPTAILTL
jgi:DNA-binding GntR family transcriptional regulator